MKLRQVPFNNLAASFILVVLSFLFPPARADQPALASELIGYQTLDYMNTLPALRGLVICREVSTHDKMGGNDNGFTNKAEFVRREFGPRVALMDAAGPGCLTSFWYSWPNIPEFQNNLDPLWRRLLGKVRFFFDGETKPRLALPLRDLVGTEPFTFPLAVTGSQSTGGYLSYVPMPFQDGLKITVDGAGLPAFFQHCWYHSYPHGTVVPSWPPGPELAGLAAGWDPEAVSRPAGEKTEQLSDLNILPGQSRELFNHSGPGTIKCLRMKLPEDDAALRGLTLRAWWDGEIEPGIDAPLSLLFALEHRFSKKDYTKVQNADLTGLVVGQDRGGNYFLRLPMPFARSARLTLENRHAETVSVERVRVEYDERARPGAGNLRTQFHESADLPPGRDYLLADLTGRGHIVGTVLSVEDTPVNFLEGDERIYFDGSRSPLVMGDATETYFNGSWYFCGQAFVCPLHGAPTFHESAAGTDITMYRFHLTDFAPFRGAARFSIQHGAFNNVFGRYRSLVFYYGVPTPGLTRSDYLKMSDAGDRAAHGFSASGPAHARARTGFFEGEFCGQDLGLTKKPGRLGHGTWMALSTVAGVFHDAPKNSPDRVGFTVVSYSEPYEFTAAVDPEADAVLLRRVFDQSVPDQRAVVEVDGIPAGEWFNAGGNQWKIWSEDDLILDPAVTRGKSQILIKIIPVSPSFTAAEYAIFSLASGL